MKWELSIMIRNQLKYYKKGDFMPMTNLRKILEELHPHQIGFGEDKLDLAHQQILALIPKKLTEQDLLHKGELIAEHLERNYLNGFNACISAMEQSMTGEK